MTPLLNALKEIDDMKFPKNKRAKLEKIIRASLRMAYEEAAIVADNTNEHEAAAAIRSLKKRRIDLDDNT